MYNGTNVVMCGDDMSTVIVSELSDGAYDDKYDYKGDHVLMIHDLHYMWSLVGSGKVKPEDFDIYKKDKDIFGKVITRLTVELGVKPGPDNACTLYNNSRKNFNKNLLALGACIEMSIANAMINKQFITLRRG